jgi:CRISPR/Cas system-associated exonuclease Cas4 (RecB family)
LNESEIEKGVLELVKSSIMGGERSRSGSIHVTALTGPCMRKPYYEILGEEQTRDYKSMAVMKLGTIVHELIILDKKNNEMALAGNIRKMIPISPKKITPMNFFDCISGKVDDIVNINGELVIVDKKTYSSVTARTAEDPEAKYYGKYEKKELDEDYVFQLNEYKLLYYLKTGGTEIKTGAIVYLDTATRFIRPKVFETKLMSIEEIKQKVIEKLDILKKASQTGELPDRSISWRCRYTCPFTKICKPEEDPRFEELTKR